MNHSAKKRHHEEARKKHKHEMDAHAREGAKLGRSKLPLILLVVGIALMIGLVAFVSLR